MYGATMRVVNAQHVKRYNNCNNTGLKLLKTKVAIWFNKILYMHLLVDKVILRNARCDDEDLKGNLRARY